MNPMEGPTSFANFIAGDAVGFRVSDAVAVGLALR